MWGWIVLNVELKSTYRILTCVLSLSRCLLILFTKVKHFYFYNKQIVKGPLYCQHCYIKKKFNISSKHFIMFEVKTTGLNSLKTLGKFTLALGLIYDSFHLVGISFSSHQLSSSNWLSWFFTSPTQCCIFIFFSTAIFMLTALLNLLTACLPSSRGLAAQDFLLLLIPILSIFLMRELTSIFTFSSLTLVNSETLFLRLFFHLPMIWTLSKEECQDTSNVNWN